MTEFAKDERLDKWLWYARFVKTRSLAQKIITQGKLRLDGEKIINPARKVRPDNVLTITLEREVKIIKILGLPQRRGPYVEAQTFYEDLCPVSAKQ